jgi:predicted branched-subunit amino acid permease
VTGGVVFALHLGGTVVGAGLGSVLSDLEAIGMDAAVPAAFVGLLAPSVRRRPQLATALAGGAVAVVALFFVPASVAVLTAIAGAGAGLVLRRRQKAAP